MYKHFGIIKEINKCKDDIELLLDDNDCINIPDINKCITKNIIKIGRIVCYITDQSSQGIVYSIYIKTLSKDFETNGWFKKNQDYYFNPNNKLEQCPQFVLVYRNQ